MEESKSAYNIGSILQEMREEYWKGLADTVEEREEELECVVFTLGGETYAFETIHAAEVLRIPKLVKVPQVPDLVVGVFNLRGEITAAMDIRGLLGIPAPAITSSGRIVVVKSEKFITGILTENVKGVASLSFSGFEPVTRNLTGTQRELIRGQIRTDTDLVILLDVGKLVSATNIAE